tara:strand:+ start:1106 stop:1348 length:243 start_codon:yes stop_codon:yes gene_type:complete
MSKKETWSYDWSWTQPYVSMEEFFNSKPVRELAQKNSQEDATLKEISLLDSIDENVQNMLTYPEAESILNKIMKKENGYD